MQLPQNKTAWSALLTAVVSLGIGIFQIIAEPKIDPEPVPPVVEVVKVVPKVKPKVVEVVPDTEVTTTTIVERDGAGIDGPDAQAVIRLVDQGNTTYRVIRSQTGNQTMFFRVVVSDGTSPQPPPVVVPPDVPPVVVPPAAGKRGIAILHESANQSPKFADTLVLLRKKDGEAKTYFAAKGHELWIIDPNAKDKDDKPIPAVEEWKALAGNLKLPVEIIYDRETKKVLNKRELSVDSTKPADIIASVKTWGG